jgi:hypothetical protein
MDKMDARPGCPFPLSVELPAVLEFTGEFGAEINSFVPFTYWLYLAGLMQDRRIRTYPGMRPFYFYLHPEQIEEKQEARRYVHPLERPVWLPTRNDHASCRNAFETFPDYRTAYGDAAFFASERPLLIVHNKFTIEWNRAPVNYFSPALLERVFGTLSEHFQIVYIRPGFAGAQAGYSADQQPDLPFGDAQVVRQFPNIWLLDDLVEGLRDVVSYNEIKLRLLASSWFHLTVQGGNAHLAALFSGTLVTVLHRFGQEIRHTYRHGHFGYAANPTPAWLICRSEAEVSAALPVLADSRLIAGRAVPSPVHAAIVEALSPDQQCGHDRMGPTDLPPLPIAA